MPYGQPKIHTILEYNRVVFVLLETHFSVL